MTADIRILIAEDQALQREGYRALLTSVAGFDVLDVEVADGEAAVREVTAHEPDIVLMDLGMPGLNGIEATREIKRRALHTRVLVLTATEAEYYLTLCRDAGASGYVRKSATRDELVRAIRAVVRGAEYFDEPAAEPTAGITVTPDHMGAEALDLLTRRETQILKFIAAGHKNREIAEMLDISIKTVETHRLNLMKKLELHSAADVTAFAHRHGMTS